MQTRMIGAMLLGAALCACAADGTANAPAPVQPVAAASGPFDGRYVGPIRVTTGGANCGASGETRTLVIAGNAVSVLYSPSRNQTARGTVDTAGKVSASNLNDRLTVSGQITGDRLPATVTFGTSGCVYAFELTKQG